MKLHEYQAKQLLAKAGIPVLPGVVATTAAEAGRAYETLRQGPQGATGVEKPSLAISVYNASGDLVDEVSVGSYDQARDFYYATSLKKKPVLAVNSRFVKEDVINYLETLIGIDER